MSVAIYMFLYHSACRILHGKTAHSPIIIDIVDQWVIGRAQFNKRKVYYDKAGFTIASYS